MVNINETSGVILAYLGDAVWELYVRRYVISKGFNNNKANKLVKEMVNAKVQSRLVKEIYSSFSEKECELFKRAKNSNIKSFPSSCSVMEYREATAFEAMIGVFYETNQLERIEEIVKICENINKKS